MNVTTSHNHSIKQEDFENFREIFNNFYDKELEIWTKFQKFWMSMTKTIPVYIVRYEDLLSGKLLS